VIRYIHLTNFRRHADTEISFEQSGQIVLIAGRNGSGKSTIVEAITYALYGEGRYGNRNIDRLIRHGAEIEGMEVELVFDVADTVYRVRRRRDNKLSSAVLYGNDEALVEGPREVTEEVGALLGMDSRGFRLAVVAQQKELDGLASMRPGVRAGTLSRLLRLDAVVRAKDGARAIYRSEQDALRGLGSAPDRAESEATLAQHRTSLETTEVAFKDSMSAVANLEKAIEEGRAGEEAYQGALATHKRLELVELGASQELARVESDYGSIDVGPELGEAIDLEALNGELREIDAGLALAEANERLREQAHMVATELARAKDHTEQLRAESETLTTLIASYDEGFESVCGDGVALARESLAASSNELLRAQDLLVHENARSLELLELGAECELCGQEVSDEHRSELQKAMKASIAATSKRIKVAEKNCAKAKTDLETAETALAGAQRTSREVAAAKERSSVAEIEKADLSRRITTYEGQLARLVVEDVDVALLQSRRGEVSLALGEAKRHNEALSLRSLLEERKRTLGASLAGAQERLVAARAASAEARVGGESILAHERYQALEEALSGERALSQSLTTRRAVALERLGALEREAEKIAATAKRREDLAHAAQVASITGAVLEGVATRLNQQIRPDLEGAIGELLSRLSEGKFEGVSLDEEYNISVFDQGALRALGDFSGGEIDLIALAVRLALASVVSERHGAGGAGFLILDECFGSQDQGRRESILAALRGLRGLYGQILLISHVGGIDDAADRVIEIEVDEESGEACVNTK
jgi:exonuclease SbcC